MRHILAVLVLIASSAANAQTQAIKNLDACLGPLFDNIVQEILSTFPCRATNNCGIRETEPAHGVAEFKCYSYASNACLEQDDPNQCFLTLASAIEVRSQQIGFFYPQDRIQASAMYLENRPVGRRLSAWRAMDMHHAHLDQQRCVSEGDTAELIELGVTAQAQCKAGLSMLTYQGMSSMARMVDLSEAVP